MSDRLRPFEADRLRGLRFTYPEVGATSGPLPAGYHHLDEAFVLGHDRAVFEDAAVAVLRWGVQRGAGLRVSASSDDVEPGAVAIVRLGWGPFAVKAPVRVVEVIEEPDRSGFVYGTLPGHPELGEESFVVEYDGSVVTLRIRAFSRPGSWLGTVAGPVGRFVQRRVTRRYGRALL